jgi:hypothetical protein
MASAGKMPPPKIHPAEEATIRAFVVASKRERLLGILSSTKRRKKAVESLNHFVDWDVRYAHPISASANILAVLVGAGAGEECHVISDNRTLDGRTLRLVDAIDAAEIHPFASVLCCVPGRLAFFFDEADTPRN